MVRAQRFERAVNYLDTGETATVETSVIRFISAHPTQHHLEGGNYSADNLLFSSSLHFVVTHFDCDYVYGQGSGD